MQETVNDPQRLISETLQLENYIFSRKPFPHVKEQQSDKLSDWTLRLDKHKEIATFVQTSRKEILDFAKV